MAQTEQEHRAKRQKLKDGQPDHDYIGEDLIESAVEDLALAVAALLRAQDRGTAATAQAELDQLVVLENLPEKVMIRIRRKAAEPMPVNPVREEFLEYADRRLDSALHRLRSAYVHTMPPADRKVRERAKGVKTCLKAFRRANQAEIAMIRQRSKGERRKARCAVM